MQVHIGSLVIQCWVRLGSWNYFCRVGNGLSALLLKRSLMYVIPFVCHATKDIDSIILCRAFKGILIVDLMGQDKLSLMNEFQALTVA